MEVFLKRTDELIPYALNAKRHDERQIADVANSIRENGWKQPLVIDKNNVVVIGHCRLLAAKRLGHEFVPCVSTGDMTEKQIRKLRLVDNKTNESDWIEENAAKDSEDLEFEGYSFDFKDAGAITFADFDGAGDGGGSMMARGKKVRVVIGALMFDIEDPTHELYDLTRGADKELVGAYIKDAFIRGDFRR